MPPPNKARSGWHVPGYNYCGPFTDISDETVEPIDDIDECCRQHDLNYNDPDVTTAEADQDLIDCLPSTSIGLGIKGVFKAKQAVDSLTNHGTDSWFRRGIAQKRKIDQYYRDAKRARTETSARTEGGFKRRSGPIDTTDVAEGDTPIIMSDQGGDVDVENNGPPAKRSKRSANNSNGGGGISGAGDDSGEIERPLGQASRRHTTTYRKSFIVYIQNGLTDNANYGWKQTTPAQNRDHRELFIEWNEGWQIVPWGIYANAISRHEWNMLNLSSRRWRPVEFGVTIEGIIPFQNVLQSSGTREAVASFSNRPNMHIFVDDGHILPTQEQWAAEHVEHNDYWGATSLNFTRSKLASPKFKLYNIQTADWSSKSAGLPAENLPQKLFSLYNTGKVQSIYAGQKFHRKHRVMNAQWRGNRGQMDKMRYAKQLANGQDKYQVMWGNLENMLNPCETFGGVPKERDMSTSGFFADPPLPAQYSDMNEADPRGAHYADTFNRLPHYAPPYILVKMETYHQPDDTPIQIYAQAHIHYEVTIEHEDLDAYGNFFDPTNYAEIAAATSDHINADKQVGFACGAGPCDNEIGRIFTENVQAYNWA